MSVFDKGALQRAYVFGILCEGNRQGSLTLSLEAVKIEYASPDLHCQKIAPSLCMKRFWVQIRMNTTPHPQTSTRKSFREFEFKTSSFCLMRCQTADLANTFLWEQVVRCLPTMPFQLKPLPVVKPGMRASSSLAPSWGCWYPAQRSSAPIPE